jgi:aminoglycoside phosphotransferase (APT) family kinase protein
VPSKNPTWIARDADGARAFVQLPNNEPGARLGVVHEGRILALLADMAPPTSAGWSLPGLRAFDPAAGVLALDWADGENLHYNPRRTGRYPPEAARAIGRALAWLHAATRDRRAELPDEVGQSASTVEPLLFLDPYRYSRLSRAGIAFYSAIQADGTALRSLQAMLRAEVTGCLLHGDMKQANLLRRGGGAITLLDWELAHWGDPAADLGALIANYVPAWLAPRSAIEHVEYPGLVAFFSALLGSYRHARRGAFPLERDFVLRVMRWAGATMLSDRHAITILHGRFDEREATLTRYALDMINNPYRWAWELLEVLP